MREEKKLSKKKTEYKKLEAEIEKSFGGYMATNLECLHDDYNAWTFDVFFDLIIGMRTSKEDSAAKDKGFDFEGERKGKKRRRKKKRKRKNKQELEDTHNVLGDLNAEEFSADKFAKPREEAQRRFDAKLFSDGLEIEDGVKTLDLEKIKEEIPKFKREEDTLFNTDHIQRIPTASTNLKLVDLLDFHFSTQMLNNVDNFYTCPKCSEEVDLEKEIRFVTLYYRIWKAPEFFSISLKRFRQQQRSFGVTFVKDDRYVEFPMELDISKYCLRKSKYLIPRQK